MTRLLLALVVAICLPAAGCGGQASEDGSAGEGRRSGPPGGGRAPGSAGRPGPGRQSAAVPVEVAAVQRRTIARHIESNGALEAENEVDIVARIAGPIVAMNVEEGDRVRRGQLLARLDDAEYRAQLEIARVTLNEATLAFERARNLQAEELISPEAFEQARSSQDTATAQLDAAEILLGFTEIRAPFDGLIVSRYVKFAESVSAQRALLRISDFDPLLCPIQIPERDLPSVRPNQRAYLTVEPWPDRRFDAHVLRISPVVDAATGTVKVTLQAKSEGLLRPGMFARVFVEIEQRADALVIPKSALALDSIGDTVYVADGSVASRREVELGFAEGDFIEIVSGLEEGDVVIVVGQDGLSDGTPIQGPHTSTSPSPPADADPPAGAGRRVERPEIDAMSPEQLAQLKTRMRARGLSEDQIAQRIESMRNRSEPSSR